MPNDLDALQGTWRITSLEVDGAQSDPGGQATIEVRGDRFTTRDMGAPYGGIVRLVRGRTNKGIDLEITEGHAAGTTSTGIYTLDQDRWVLCLSTRGGARPRRFATKPDSGLALETLERLKGVKPGAKARAATGAPPKPEPLLIAPYPSDAPATEWEGEWAMTTGVFSGSVMDNSMKRWARRVTHGDVTTVLAGPQVMLRARFSLDHSKSPAHVEYVNLAGSHKGKTQLGIAERVGDVLRVCTAAPGKARPDAFQSVKGDGRSMTEWKKVI